ncbi:MAG: hypothetical protein KAJ29_03620 [Alphaproteobacteria bacterium]|nr:hypothetical protein [Alphaproteobacteria bacterium]
MKHEFFMRASNLFWKFHWSGGENPVVCFSNPKVSANVIYTLRDIEIILARDAIRKSQLPVPLCIMQRAYEESKALAQKVIAA